MKLIGIAATLALAMATFSVNRADAQQRCWTAGDCARKCADVWKQFHYASAKDCVARHPCSKYPKSCKRSDNKSPRVVMWVQLSQH